MLLLLRLPRPFPSASFVAPNGQFSSNESTPITKRRAQNSEMCNISNSLCPRLLSQDTNCWKCLHKLALLSKFICLLVSNQPLGVTSGLTFRSNCGHNWMIKKINVFDLSHRANKSKPRKNVSLTLSLLLGHSHDVLLELLFRAFSCDANEKKKKEEEKT